ncbi:MAG TPA: hypothetical protein VN688_17655 [Gemmataceae bacterium]|nr:hypothetical protein [Gemmataceae bacterium]
MNEANTSTYQEWVLRRLSDPLTIRGHEFPWWVWPLLLGSILVAGFFYIIWMYVKDSRGVGIGWAGFLALLRMCVYLLLAGVFMLPAKQTWEETRVMGKTLVLLDTSASLTKVADAPTTGKVGEKLRTRQDDVFAFLTDDKVKFFANLEAKNPVTAFRFASRLDDNYLLFKDGRNWTREEWETFLRNADRNVETPEPKPMTPEFLQAWLNPGKKVEVPVEAATAEKERLAKLQALTQKLGEAGMFGGTNVGSAALSLLNRELNGRVQGLVLVTDGRSTEGSPKMFEDIEARAKAAHIPIFVVAVGEERPQVKIDIVDIRVPEQVQPEDKFRAVVELQGEGLPEKPVKVFLDVTYTKKNKSGKDEDLDITLTEQVNKNSPSEKREQMSLGTKKLTLEPSAPVQFDRSSPPRVTIDFPIDALALAKAAHIDLEAKGVAGRKWELSETGEGELRFRVRVPRDTQEAFASPFHLSEPSILRVVKKPLRVLVFTSAATRDYQFLRSILIREMDKKRAEVSICMQLPPGVTEHRGGIVQDVPADRLLSSFPTRLEAKDNDDDKVYALDQYDVIVAFDPDWTQLSAAQLKMVERWVEKGGGLVAVGGPINTLELARPKANKDKLKPILDLYPVVLSDIRISDFDRQTNEPWALNFTGATPDMEFLKLDEGEDATKFLSDWDAFFYGRGKEGGDKNATIRGFYSYYPVEKAKTTAVVVARFTDPKSKLKDNSQQPYIVMTSPSSNRRVVWLGSGEIWRLRSFSVPYHERFWTKLLRYAASNNMSRVSKRIRLYMGSNHVANKPIEFEGKFEGKEGEALAPNGKPPAVTIMPPNGLPDSVVPKPFAMKAKATGDGWFSARFQVRSAGDYTMTVKSPETGDTLTQRFSVKEANPEMDNTRPDFQTMYQLASEADDVLGRMTDAERVELKRSLSRPKLEGAAKGEVKDDKLRLYFDLKNAHLIPTCMRPDIQTLRNRGPIQDLWDEGFVVWNREAPYQPIKMSWVLVGVVGLLSVEWLTRKLLRLA